MDYGYSHAGYDKERLCEPSNVRTLALSNLLTYPSADISALFPNLGAVIVV